MFVSHFLNLLAVLGLCSCAQAVSSFGEQGLLSRCGVQSSHCGCFSLQSTGSKGTWAQ